MVRACTFGLPGDLSYRSSLLPQPVLPHPRWQHGPARLRTERPAPIQGLKGPRQLTKAPSVPQNGKLGRVGVPGQCLSQPQWDSVLYLHSQLPFLISSLSPFPGDISSLHSACCQLNPRPDVGGTICTPQPPPASKSCRAPKEAGQGPGTASSSQLPKLRCWWWP